MLFQLGGDQEVIMPAVLLLFFIQTGPSVAERIGQRQGGQPAPFSQFTYQRGVRRIIQCAGHQQQAVGPFQHQLPHQLSQ